jgi:hypothetical protein
MVIAVTSDDEKFDDDLWICDNGTCQKYYRMTELNRP